MWLPNPRMVKQAASHLGMAAATAVVITSLQAKGITFSGLTLTRATEFANEASKLLDALGGMFTSLTTFLGIGGGAYAMYKSMWAVSDRSSIQATSDIANDPKSLHQGAAQKQLVDAVATIASNPDIPIAQEAKIAVVDAAASIPEVVGEIKVTDPAIASATVSTQVVLAT